LAVGRSGGGGVVGTGGGRILLVDVVGPVLDDVVCDFLRRDTAAFASPEEMGEDIFLKSTAEWFFFFFFWIFCRQQNHELDSH
jgi:hypothetical protein